MFKNFKMPLIISSILFFSACAGQPIPATTCYKPKHISDARQILIVKELENCGANCKTTAEFITSEVMDTWAALDQC